jgi:hypothetical protein
MTKIILIMLMCSTTPGNDCQIIPTPVEEFKDNFECTVYGYSYSTSIISSLSRDFVNKYGAYTRFTCEKREII